MKLPKEIRVGANDYKVKAINSLLDDSDNLGNITYSNATIRIDDSLAESTFKETLAHELVHAMLYESGYYEHNEDQVIRLGKVLSMILRDNDFTFMRDPDEETKVTIETYKGNYDINI